MSAIEILRAVTTHRLWAVILIAAGTTVFAFAKQISALKSSAWARYYQRHPKAAQRNPLSVHAGTESSIRFGAFMWRLVGLAIILNGLIRLQ
jgi:hypothetical protein